jgi:hypothetical protein
MLHPLNYLYQRARLARVERPVIVASAGRQEAIRFAVEESPAVRTLGAWMRVGDERFDGDGIWRLYESDDYPRRRRERKSS